MFKDPLDHTVRYNLPPLPLFFSFPFFLLLLLSYQVSQLYSWKEMAEPCSSLCCTSESILYFSFFFFFFFFFYFFFLFFFFLSFLLSFTYLASAATSINHDHCLDGLVGH